MTPYRITQGDILAVRGQSWMSRQIIKATGGPCSHVGLFLCGGDEPLVIEANTRVVTRYLTDSLQDSKKAWVLHPINLDMRQRIGIVRGVCSFSGKSYGWWNLIPHFFDTIFRTNLFTTYLTFYRYPICSGAVGWGYASEGLYFGQSPQCLSPAEIFAYAKKNTDKYRIWEIQ